MSARPGSGVAAAAAAPRPAARARSAAVGAAPPGTGAPSPPGRAGPCSGQRREPGTCAGGTGGRRHRGLGGGQAGTLGGAATPRSPRPPRAVCAAGHSPIPRSRRFTAQESRALFSPRSFPTEAAGWRCPVDRGSGKIRAEEGCYRAGVEPQPLLRTGQDSCLVPGGPGWPSTASSCRSRPAAMGRKAPCRATQAGEGTRPWAPAGWGRFTRHSGGRGIPAPPSSAAPAPKRAARKIKWWGRCKALWKG